MGNHMTQSSKGVSNSSENVCVPEGFKPLDKQCISIELAALLNTSTATKMTKGRVVEEIWSYILKHNLQNPYDPNYVVPDDKMAAVFGKERFVGFTMARYLERHYKKEYLSTFDMHDESEGLGPFDKQCLSHELRSLINVDKATKLTRDEAVRRVWNYVDEKDLKDPEDSRYIVPDEKMSAVFGCGRFVGFTISIHLENHFKRDHTKVNPTFNIEIEEKKEYIPTSETLWRGFSNFGKKMFAGNEDNGGGISTEEKEVAGKTAVSSIVEEDVTVDTILNDLNRINSKLDLMSFKLDEQDIEFIKIELNLISSKLEQCSEKPSNYENTNPMEKKYYTYTD